MGPINYDKCAIYSAFYIRIYVFEIIIYQRYLGPTFWRVGILLRSCKTTLSEITRTFSEEL